MTSRLEKAQEQLQKAEARVQRLDAQEKERRRKEDTRRKIVAGAIALKLMDERREFRDWFSEQLGGRLKTERDRRLFDLCRL